MKPLSAFEETRRRRLAGEREVVRLSRPGPESEFRVALGFPNRYEVGMSNLGFQWTHRILCDEPGVVSERFFVEESLFPPRTYETGRPIGDFPVVAFSVSWEMDYPLVLKALASAGIPIRSADRGPEDPVIVFGGNCARINPAPLLPYVDVLAVGDAEKLVPELGRALREARGDREVLTASLTSRPGFHLPRMGGGPGDEEGERGAHSSLPAVPIVIQQKKPREEFGVHQVPHTVLLTPETELRDKLLIEIARGCTEMCRFCWAAYAFAPIVRHSAAQILAVAERGRPFTDRVGLIATAVADHPEILPILDGLEGMGFHIALSSIKIDAIQERILEILNRQGERALSIAPEAGNDRLRRAVNKKVSDEMLDEKMRMIFRAGFTHLKLYLQIGLPGETDSDVSDLVELVRRAHALALEEGRKLGRIATVVAAVNTFVPKPHTPFENERLIPLPEIERKMSYLAKEISKIPNTILRGMPPKEAVWEAYLAKASAGSSAILERVAAGEKPARMLREFRAEFARVVWGEIPKGDRPWGFLRKRLPPQAGEKLPQFVGDM